MQVKAGVNVEAVPGLAYGSASASPVSISSSQPVMGQHSQQLVMNSIPHPPNTGANHETGASSSKPAKKSSNARTNGYRAKELEEIKNGLKQFEKSDTGPREISRELREPLRTVSSLSTESSTNSVSSENGSTVASDTIQKLNILGYEEASAMRAVNMGHEGALGLDHANVLQQHSVNGLASTNHSGLTAGVVRKPSLEQRDGYRVSPAAAAGTEMNRRCDNESPGAGAGAAPALPPRSSHQDMTNAGLSLRQYSPSSEQPPPLPPPRGAHNPPPTPPRGTTPPPLPPHNASVVVNGHGTIGPAHMNGTHPMLLKRMSPVPGPGRHQAQVPVPVVTRGQSPVSRVACQPMVVTNSLEAQQQVAQQMQQLSIFSGDQQEPPPPYPMGTAALNTAAPPSYSYSQTLAMRQSPTLSSTSSDYRRSPLLQYPNVYMSAGHGIVNGIATPTSPLPAAPSPVNSVLSASGSSMSSRSSQAWSVRQNKTHSPIIMHSVRSTQVQKPVLQQAHGVAAGQDHAPPAVLPRSAVPQLATGPTGLASGANSVPPPPPPSYADSIQKKGSGPPTPIPQSPVPMSTTPVPTTNPPSYNSTNPPSYNASIQAKQRGLSPQVPDLPPPPPYPSTAVSKHDPYENLVSATPIIARQSPVINTAKVVHNNANLVRTMDQSSKQQQPLQRKYSPHLSETSSNSRSDSPVSGVSECATISSSPVQFVNNANMETQDSGICFPQDNQNSEMAPPPPPPYKQVHHVHTSPRPERKTYSREFDEMRNESKIKKYPPQAFKFFMEQHVENVIKYYEDRRKRAMQLEQEMAKYGMDERNQEQFRIILSQKESNYIRLKRAKMNKSQFRKIKTIGKGAFGEVSLVRKVDGGMNHSGQLYAMKTLNKSEVLMRNQVAHVRAEKDILAEADNEWIVKLYHSFQDQNNLYFVMDYIPGGDLMSLLIKKGIFEEPLAKFYISELVCAVDSVHKMGFIHRDIKPDNILIDANGHIKLTDFGLCTGFRWTHDSKYYQNNVNGHSRQDSMDPGNLDLDSGRCSCPTITNGQKLLERRKKHARCIAHSLVGTPNYIAPEVLERRGYSQLCDWWSVGVILYEMLVGQPPFLANGPAETQLKVIRWYDSLKIPRSACLSRESQDLILSLCTGEQQRLGKNGFEEIKKHDFFKGIDFSVSLRSNVAPYKPEIKFPEDTSNFDPIDDKPDGRRDAEDDIFNGEDNNRDYHGFYEFTFRRFFDDAGHPVFSPGPNALRSMRQVEIDDNENPSGPVYV